MCANQMDRDQTFDYFVGIDWSGAKGIAHRGISVFLATPGNRVPVKIQPQRARHWSRTEVLAYLEALSSSGRVLAGIDFAFAHPFADCQAYFPHHDTAPQTARELWALIDQINQGQDDFYGGGIWDDDEFGGYYNAPSGRKGRYFSSRRRQTEQAARTIRAPSPTFNCVGPAGVGTGSLAGMRMLHYLAQTDAQIWPFMPDRTGARLTVAEIFPSYYFAQAGIRPVKGAQAQSDALTAALAYFGSEGVSDDFIALGPDNDDADALVSAAALRAGASQIADSLPASALTEGWIFGVK